jgi:hypothetical protein
MPTYQIADEGNISEQRDGNALLGRVVPNQAANDRAFAVTEGEGALGVGG